MTATLDNYNPEATQRRLASTPSGRQVWIKITAADRAECLKEIGRVKPRYEYFMRKREDGVPYENLEREARCDPEVFREAMGAAWSIYETMLHDIASARAKLLP